MFVGAAGALFPVKLQDLKMASPDIMKTTEEAEEEIAVLYKPGAIGPQGRQYYKKLPICQARDCMSEHSYLLGVDADAQTYHATVHGVVCCQ